MLSDLIAARRSAFDIAPAGDGPAIEVHGGIWLSEGRCNSYLIQTHVGRVVIDGGSADEGPVHRRRYDQVSTGPLRFLLLTQGDDEHVAGAGALVEDGTEVVATAAYAARRADAPAPEPSLTFDERLELTVGEDRFELWATPGGERGDSMIVWLPDRRIAVVGNLFSLLVGHLPDLTAFGGGRDAARFVESAQLVIDLEPELLLTGHFGPIAGPSVIRTELTRVRNAMEYLVDATAAARHDGVDVWAAIREITLPPALRVGEGDGTVAWAVRSIWEREAGWFHQRSTTELYGMPPGPAAEDLVELAGGSSSVVARAAHHVSGDRPLDAIALIDAVLEVEPDNRSAWVCSRSAHERLLEAALARVPVANFREVAWLRQQIARAERHLSPTL